MSIELLSDTLFWCTLINLGLLVIWSLSFALARERLFRLHSRWFKLSEERFDAIHYAGLAWFKLSILMFNLVPWIALRLAA